jgi:hypothetical protein
MHVGHGGGELVVFALESRSMAGLPPAALLRIEQTARRFNERMGLTGELRLEGQCFALTVEGPSGLVLPLAGRILADPRHRAIRVTAFTRLAERRFEAWTSSGFGSGTAANALPLANAFMPAAGWQPGLRALAGAGGRC